MKHYFNEEELFGQITARLLADANDRTTYECMCDIIITNKYLYVREDNYNGTYNYHFKIQTENVISVNKYIQKDEFNSEEKSSYKFIRKLFLIFGNLMGVIQLKKQNVTKEFLEIKFTKDNDQFTSIFFEDCSNIGKIVQAFKNYKSFYY